MKTWFQHKSLLSDDQQKVVTDGYPYLREYSIHAGVIEGFNVEMLSQTWFR
jgi:hypothetical protein